MSLNRTFASRLVIAAAGVSAWLSAGLAHAQAVIQITVQNDSPRAIRRVSSSAGTAQESAPATRIAVGGSDRFTVTARDAGPLQGSATYASADDRYQCRFVYAVTPRGGDRWSFEHTGTSVGPSPVTCRVTMQSSDARAGSQSLMLTIR
jgi:hypothetical protein